MYTVIYTVGKKKGCFLARWAWSWVIFQKIFITPRIPAAFRSCHLERDLVDSRAHKPFNTSNRCTQFAQTESAD